MAKQWVELERMVIKAGEMESSVVPLHSKTGTTAVVTIYTPPLPHGESAKVLVTPDGATFVKFVHRGQELALGSGSATDIPLVACKGMRVAIAEPAEADLEFRVLVMLEVD